MNIIESTNVDMIAPYPNTELRRVFKWLKAYKNIVESDASPKTSEDFEAQLAALISTPGVESFGVIDKNNQLNFKAEAPLIGMIIYEPASLWNAYCHVASTRRAWGSGFLDEGIRVTLDYMFNNYQSLQRVSALVLESNGPVKGLVRRLGAKYEGTFYDMILQNGEPKNLLHFGITRRKWMDRPLPQEVAPEII